MSLPLVPQFDVIYTYTTDVDTDAATDMVNGPLSPGRHKVFLSVGHDEYWSWQMRDNIEKARNRTNQPLHIGWFGGNNVHWQIRFANSSSVSNPGNSPRRTIIAYKGLATSSNPNWRDPLFTPVAEGGSLTNYLTTALWRNMRSTPELGTQCPTTIPNCFKHPEDEVVGVMTNLTNPVGRGNFEFVSLPLNHWVTRNVPDPVTPFAGLVGYEADEFIPASANYPGRASTMKIADSAFAGKLITTRSHAVYYTMTSGARVFSVGTIEWGLGLDSFGSGIGTDPDLHDNYYDSDAEAVTTNILVCLRDGGTACS